MKNNAFNYGLTGEFDVELPNSVCWSEEFESAPGMGVLFDRYQIEHSFFKKVVEAYQGMRPHLIACCSYSVEELLGIDFFNGLSTKEKGLARLCVRHLAELQYAEFSSHSSEEWDFVSELTVD